MNTSLMTRLAATALCAAALAAVAPSQSLSRSHVRYCGNSTIGSKLDCYGQLYRSSSLLKARGRVIGYARLFGRTYEGARVEGLSQVSGTGRLHRATVKIAGYTVYDLNRSYAWGWNWSYSRQFFRKDHTFWMAAIPVNCEVRVTGNVFAGITLGYSNQARANGHLGANAWGSAGVGVDLLAYRAGVRADITVFENRLESTLRATSSSVSGSLRYVSQSLRMLLKLFLDQAYVKVSWRGISRGWKEIASLRLIDWSAGSRTYTILSA